MGKLTAEDAARLQAKYADKRAKRAEAHRKLREATEGVPRYGIDVDVNEIEIAEEVPLTAAHEIRDLMYEGMDKSKRQSAYDTLRYMVENNELKGFAADVARTVVQYNRCSPKQFVIIESAARKLPYSHS